MSNEKWDAYIINSFLCGFSKVLYLFDNHYAVHTKTYSAECLMFYLLKFYQPH